MISRHVLCAISFATGLICTSVSAKVQCSCPTIRADGEGNTSCSAAESSGRCTVDFNLFGAEAEARAAQLLEANSLSPRVTLFRPDSTRPSFEALIQLSRNSRDRMVDAVLIYLAVGAANQERRFSNSVSGSALRELIRVAKSPDVSTAIERAFNDSAFSQWGRYSDSEIRVAQVPVSTHQSITIAPGCIEFRDQQVWLMFKAAWSPMRVIPRCRG